jgi:hypothetical protein
MNQHEPFRRADAAIKKMASLLPPPAYNPNESSPSLAAILPAPKNIDNLKQRALTATERVNAIVEKTAVSVRKPIPFYGQRKNFIPSLLEVSIYCFIL